MKPYSSSPECRSAIKLNKFRLSHRQKWTPNPDPKDYGWKQIFFWTEGVRLLGYAGWVFKELEKMDATEQEQFWRGTIPARVLKDLRSQFVQIIAASLVEYCKVWQSQNRAFWILGSKARREKLNPNGTVSIAGVHLDDKCYALRRAELDKSVANFLTRQVISQAAERNDVRFFIQLGRALQKRQKPLEVDWTRCDPIACFMVVNWCKATHFRQGLPLLCQFTDQALADFCSIALGRKAGNPTAEVIRQWRKRLSLMRPKRQQIRSVTVQGDEILFA